MLSLVMALPTSQHHEAESQSNRDRAGQIYEMF